MGQPILIGDVGGIIQIKNVPAAVAAEATAMSARLIGPDNKDITGWVAFSDGSFGNDWANNIIFAYFSAASLTDTKDSDRVRCHLRVVAPSLPSGYGYVTGYLQLDVPRT